MTDSPPDVERLSEPDPADRIFVDVDGMRWRVSEKSFSAYDRRRGTSLIFSSDAAVRRVREFPAAWRELSDAELVALSWKA